MISYPRLHGCWQASSTALLIVWEKCCNYKYQQLTSSKSNLVYFSQIETSTKLNAAQLVSWLCDYHEWKKTNKTRIYELFIHRRYPGTSRLWDTVSGRGLRTTFLVSFAWNYYAGVATTSNAVSFRSLWNNSALQELVQPYLTQAQRYKVNRGNSVTGVIPSLCRIFGRGW